jgi:acetoacetyl-CoA reductase
MLPDYVMTPMVAKIAAGIPVGRLGEPEEIGKAVAYLTGADSGYVTGFDLSINGGQHMS